MKTNILTVQPEMNLTNAAKLMSEKHVGSLIIINKKNKIAGILTERDILTDIVAKGKNLKDVQVKDIMSKNVITIEPEKAIEEASKIMIKRKIKKLPVIDKGKIIGIITASDIVKFEPKLIEQIEQIIDIESDTKIKTFKLSKNFHVWLKGKLNTIFGSFQIFLGLIFLIGVYMFYNEIEFLQLWLPSDLLRNFLFFVFAIMGSLFFISGFFLLSLES